MEDNTVDNLKLVYTTNKPYQIKIIESLLNDNNIKSNIIDKLDSMYLIGCIELYVDKKNYEEAKKIIDKSGL